MNLNLELINDWIFDHKSETRFSLFNLTYKILKESNQKIDLIFFLNVNKQTILKRIEKRRVLENRSDDNTDTFIKRYDTYMETTKPVLDFYSRNQNFVELDGSLEIDEITRKIDTFINV